MVRRADLDLPDVVPEPGHSSKPELGKYVHTDSFPRMSDDTSSQVQDIKFCLA